VVQAKVTLGSAQTGLDRSFFNRDYVVGCQAVALQDRIKGHYSLTPEKVMVPSAKTFKRVTKRKMADVMQ